MAKREMRLVCLLEKRPWRKCSCGAEKLDDHPWVYVTKKELQHFFKTGEVPDYRAELRAYSGGPKPVPIPWVAKETEEC